MTLSSNVKVKMAVGALKAGVSQLQTAIAANDSALTVDLVKKLGAGVAETGVVVGKALA